MTAWMNTRLVVRRGRIGIGEDEGSVGGREREKRSGGGAKMERVPVPVLKYHKLRVLIVIYQWPSGTCLDDVRHVGEYYVSNRGIGTPRAVQEVIRRSVAKAGLIELS